MLTKLFKILIPATMIVLISWLIFIHQTKPTKTQLTMYKSPTCGCCTQHAAYLTQNGYQVKIIKAKDMTSIKNKYGIEKNLESCHTIVADNYFIEGHVPVEAIDKLLTEKPAIDGISLPAMPAGSPGMPGIKKSVFKILSLINGQSSSWLEI